MEVDPDKSAIVRFGMLFTGVLVGIVGIVAAVQLHWAALYAVNLLSVDKKTS
jgi:hypothetical protein